MNIFLKNHKEKFTEICLFYSISVLNHSNVVCFFKAGHWKLLEKVLFDLLECFNQFISFHLHFFGFQFTGQNKDETVSSPFLLAKRGNNWLAR
jgi:hypothetical protein